MDSMQSKDGRGRGRRRLPQQQELPPPAISTTTSAISSANETNISWTSSELINNQLTESFATHTTISSSPSPVETSKIRISKPEALGTMGEQIDVLVNYFPVLKFPQHGFIYRYYIQIQNKRYQVISRKHRRILYGCWLENVCRKYPQISQDKIVFDDQTAIFTYDQQLPDVTETETTEKIMGPGRTKHLVEYQFSIKQAGKTIDLSLLRSLSNFYAKENDCNTNINDLIYIKQALGIVLHEHCSSKADYIYNRTFFAQPSSKNSHGYWNLELGKAAWRGFYSCLVFANGTHQLLINLDVNHGVFLKRQPFLDFLCEIMFHSPCGKRRYPPHRKVQKADMNDVLHFLDPTTKNKDYDDEMEFLLKHCKHLRVRSDTSGTIIINEICDLGKSAPMQTFEWKSKNNRLITVSDYYKEQHKSDLKYPSLPVLKMRSGLVIPMEVLMVEPIKTKKISDRQRALLSKCSLLKPSDYYQSIKDVRTNVEQQCFEKSSVATAWNFEVGPEMHKVPARVLTPPKIISVDKDQSVRQHSSIQSARNYTKIPFHQPTRFPSVWALINLSSSLDQKSCETFCDQLKDVAADRGISCHPPVLYEEYDLQQQSINQMIAALKEMMEKNDDCQFFIVILPQNDFTENGIYGELKKLCELEYGLGIVTQMITERSVQGVIGGDRHHGYSTLDNTLLKINTKLRGINSILQVPDVIKTFFERGHRIMYVGVDLFHPPAGSSDQRSIVAVVASADDVPNRYFKEIYIQNKSSSERKERIGYVVKFKEIMKSLISQYDQHRGFPPTAIIIYRDGIADSEFDSVFVKELTATREACVELSSGYQPNLTYIVVNKRHHTRFLPTNLEKNIEVGTVIDSRDVTNPTTYDFFLKSHNCNRGTSRPTHYHILYDDSELKPDEVQMLTYALCFTYARCTRSISIPAPVKYADLLMQRAKLYLPANESNRSSPKPGANTNVQQADLNKQIRLSPKLAPDALFFV